MVHTESEFCHYDNETVEGLIPCSKHLPRLWTASYLVVVLNALDVVVCH